MQCRVVLLAVLGAGLFLQGCGYIGPILPPSPRIPVAVKDLSVTEVGDSIECRFTVPQSTTDSEAISKFRSIDLRSGPDLAPFDLAQWQSAAQSLPVPIARANTALDEGRPVEVSFPVSDWLGKKVAIAVRSTEKSDHYSQWSNVVHLRVIAPLDPPQIEPTAAPDGIRIDISKPQPDTKVRIFRQGPNDQQPAEIGVADGKDYTDQWAEYGVRYVYTAVAFNDDEHANAQSKPSKSKELVAVDKFAPSVPHGLTALAGASSIEVSWERSPEKDTKGYYVFRSVDGGPFERVGALVTAPTYSDNNVQSGKTYRYRVRAVDDRGNISDLSDAVEARF